MKHLTITMTITIRLAVASLVLAMTGCAALQGQPAVRLWFHEQVQDGLPSNRRRTVTVPVSNLSISVNPHPSLTEKDVISAELIETAGGAAILVRFDRHGLNTLDQVTTSLRGRYLVVFLDGKPISAWLVDRRLSLGQFLVEAQLSDERAAEIVRGLNSEAKKNRW